MECRKYIKKTSYYYKHHLIKNDNTVNFYKNRERLRYFCNIQAYRRSA